MKAMTKSKSKATVNARIRVIAPSTSWKKDRAAAYTRAQKTMERFGFEVSFGQYVSDIDVIDSADAAKRAQDINDAFSDTNIDAIMAINGGWLANSVLPYLDWDAVKQNPKPFIGYSDITVLLNAIYAKTGNLGLLGPNLGTFGYKHGQDFTAEWLTKALKGKPPYELRKSTKWGVGRSRKQYKTSDWRVLQTGTAQGTLLGGNIATFYLLQGTEYMPRFDNDIILAIEDDDEAGEYTLREFDRRLESLLQQPAARKYIKGIIIGRFQPASKVNVSELAQVIASKNLKGVPVIGGVDFGHTVPMITLPIGGKVKISAQQTAKCEIIEV